MYFFALQRRLLSWGVPLLLTGCAGLSSAPAPLVDYQVEAFNAENFVRRYAAPPVRTCEAARRALLSQGYIVTAAASDQVTARKYFQPHKEHHVQLEFRVVCARESGDADVTVAFASGLKEQYVVRKIKESASLGVGGIGSLSLPVEGSLDSMVKVSSETVDDAALYQRFFELLGQYLDRSVVLAPS
ncbi:DUF2242 domain-containing protein [Ottowia testudinis]|uniref:DUF2242 domain-containing protein n=1 Tax=Ottowia testudinis TaxID=2816950 RepID=A0A975CI41_9BURK|nr:DUF2242 domain-containing protein [Ottowia testudinis]QTD46775.1 DUF2242 domain-containing protein [Ottowia testudinis]